MRHDESRAKGRPWRKASACCDFLKRRSCGMRTKSNGRKRTQRLRSLGPLLFFACNREEGKTNCLRLPRSCRRTSCRMAARKPWSVAVAISRTRHRFLKGTGPRPPHALLRRSQLPAKENLPALFFVKKDASSGYKHNFPERPVLHLESRIVPALSA